MILTGRAGDREVRSRLSEAEVLGSDWQVLGPSLGTGAGNPYGVAAFYRGVRLTAEAIGSLVLNVYSGEGPQRSRVAGSRVVPTTTIASVPSATCQSTRLSRAAKSRLPSSCIGVTRATMDP